MNYVGQLAGQVFVQVKELYRGLNPATLSGCIDVIVVRQPDGSLQCSPFHVRFGKMGVLRSREKVVDMEINGEPVDLHMKLGDNGEAFFVQETENDQEVVPSYLATSPILSDGAFMMSSSLMGKKSSGGPPIQTLGSTGSTGETGGVMMKKRRKRRRKARADSVRREESGDYSEGEDMFTIDISSDEGTEMESNRQSATSSGMISEGLESRFGKWVKSERISSRDVLRDETTSGSFKQTGIYTRSDGEWSPIQSPGNSRPTSPKSDSELMTKPSDADNQNPAIHWAWGELPQAATPSFLPVKSEPPPVFPVSIPVSESTHFRVITHETSSEQCGPCSEISALRLLMTVEHAEETAGMESESVRMESQTVSAETQVTTAESVAARMMSDMEETMSRPAGKTDSPSKRKDKRSRHLGSDGVYLDDITELEPEVAALYFPKSDGGAAVRSVSDPGLHSTSLSPQLVSSGGDSGVDSYCDPMGDLPSITISLCGGLTDNREITKEQFHEKMISYQQFAENPSIIDDPNLVVKIGSKYYNWNTAAPLMLAMQAFQKPLPKFSCLSYIHSALEFLLCCLTGMLGYSSAAVENIMKEKMPKKGGRWWFSWRGRNSSTKSDSISERGACGSAEQDGEMTSRHKEESSSSDEDHRATKQSSSTVQSEPGLTLGGVSYKKTLRLTSEQLLSLQLQDGPNDAVFSVTTQYQGTCRCQGTIYLWNWDDKIIISDIDGTITRSDTLGHILPTLGKDWTHQGIAHLYHKVSQNGYKFLYCSARAIGMADMTRGYLHWVNERGTMLPMGPVLLSPSSLFSALHREVIEKKPEKFKVECLNDIKNLFYPNKQPFYAAFGNRPTDVYSYKEVGVPLNRIFTVNPKGELVQEHAKTNISSYVRLGEVVDHVFPLKMRASSSDFPCSDTFSHFTYWRQQLPRVEHQGTTPPQTPSPGS
uniref:phosphatidate phosphatase n=1 Tax=Dicentrarchus labrax TaxID=13489 RepID=A0A8P4G1G5_DICLA